MRLINADALLDAIEDKEWVHITDYNIALYTVKDAPTVDAVPVRHGYWIRHNWAEEVEGCLIPNYECSVCHTWKRDESDYCPDCGARMDGKDGNDG